jgi:hypothetical protein
LCAPQLIQEEYWHAAPWYEQLALWIIAEEDKGGASPWAEYIALLPRKLNTPLHWTQEQLVFFFVEKILKCFTNSERSKLHFWLYNCVVNTLGHWLLRICARTNWNARQSIHMPAVLNILYDQFI